MAESDKSEIERLKKCVDYAAELLGAIEEHVTRLDGGSDDLEDEFNDRLVLGNLLNLAEMFSKSKAVPNERS